jgi:hypothetical protein
MNQVGDLTEKHSWSEAECLICAKFLSSFRVDKIAHISTRHAHGDMGTDRPEVIGPYVCIVFS